MKPVKHAVTSGVLGLAVYAFKGDPAPAVSCLLAGCMIDLDHIFDWVNNLGLRRGIRSLFNVYNHFDYETFEESRRDIIYLYLPLHSWELMIGFWSLCLFYPMGPVITSAFLSLTLHLYLDQRYNRFKPLSYFFIYRMYKRFETAALWDYQR